MPEAYGVPIAMTGDAKPQKSEIAGATAWIPGGGFLCTALPQQNPQYSRACKRGKTVSPALSVYPAFPIRKQPAAQAIPAFAVSQRCHAVT